MKKSEILNKARICLPLLNNKCEVDKIHDEADLQVNTLCRLWGGKGHIYCVKYHEDAFVLKHVAAPPKNMSLGDKRKADSYQVEANFYDRVAPNLIKRGIKLPQPLLVERDHGKYSNEILIGMTYEKAETGYVDTHEVLSWLAKFHAAYWGNDMADEITQNCGLQPIGSYWHLSTRPDEHAQMPNNGWEGRLKRAATALDDYLCNRDPLQCIIHGDAKDANILVSSQRQITFCDFQYCGKSPPTRDLAYFICSSCDQEDLDNLLIFYLNELKKYLDANVDPPSFEDLKSSYALAYCDFCRFMSGWGFWGSLDPDLVRSVLDRLDGGKILDSEDDYDLAMQREFG